LLHFSLLVFLSARYLYIPPATAAKLRVTEIITRLIRFIEKHSFYKAVDELNVSIIQNLYDIVK